MTTGQYIWTFTLLSIPVLGQLLLLIWSFSSATNANKRNLCRAILIITLLSFLLAVAIVIAASQGLLNLSNLQLRP